MDSSTRKRTDNPTKVSGNSFLLHFSNLCNLKSVAVPISFVKEKPKASDAAIDSSGCEELNDNLDCKVHPQPLQETSCQCLEEDVISMLFTAISALKHAYVQLQQAHIPYEPKKIDAANKIMVSELDSLSMLEMSYLSLSTLSLRSDKLKKLLIQMHFKMNNRDSEIQVLSKEIVELDVRNEQLKKNIKKKVPREVFRFDRELTPRLISDILKHTTKSIHDFAKPLISLMKASGWDTNLAANAIDNSVIYAEKSHRKYTFEAHLSRTMFGTKTDERFNGSEFDRIMRYQDPFDALLAGGDSGFSRFCSSMYVIAIPSKMESSFFGNLDQRTFVINGRHPRTPLYQAFVKMARWVWALKVLTNSLTLEAQMFYVKKGTVYCEDYMESVLDRVTYDITEKHMVEFTVTPGFRIDKTIIRCRVYLYKMNPLTTDAGFPL